MTNTVRHALRDYLDTIDEPEREYTGEVYTQVNIRSDERMTLAIDALAQRMRMSRSATAKFVLQAAIYDALDEVGLQMGADISEDGEKPVWRVMTKDEQLAIIARVQQERAG